MSDKMNLSSNEQIKAKKVRLITTEGENKVVSLREAKEYAYNLDLDLVQMNEADVPTCKVMDYSDYKYQQKRAQKEREKKQRNSKVVVKEVQLSVDIQEHDLDIRRKQIDKFLRKGNHVLIKLKLHGRAKYDEALQQLGRDKVEMFIQTIDDFSFVQSVSQSAGTITVTIKRD